MMLGPVLTLGDGDRDGAIYVALHTRISALRREHRELRSALEQLAVEVRNAENERQRLTRLSPPSSPSWHLSGGGSVATVPDRISKIRKRPESFDGS